MVRRTGSAGAVDPLLRKDGLSVLAAIGFGKKQPRHGAHKHHGIAARTRLAVAGKRTMTTVAQHRHQHHKERKTIQQVNDLSEIAREIEGFFKKGQRVPLAVWEHYDRVNNRHKKREEMIAVAEAMRKAERRTASSEENGSNREADDQHSGLGNDHKICRRRGRKRTDGSAQEPGRSWLSGRGTSCTFGSGRNRGNSICDEGFSKRHSGVPPTRSSWPSSSCQSAWGTYERQKLNELYWEFGRPPRRGTEAAREHFHRYAHRHCMVFSHRSPAEVMARLKLMFRYNALKEPNEREYWLKLGASRGFVLAADPVVDKQLPFGPAGRPVAAAETATASSGNGGSPSIDDSSPTGPPQSLPPEPPPVAQQSGKPLLRRSGGGIVSGSFSLGGRGLLSVAAASYAADAIAASSGKTNSKKPMIDNRAGAGSVSPFYDPTRSSSPAWGFGEVPGYLSCPGSRADSRGRDSRGGGDSRGDSGGGLRGRGGNEHSTGATTISSGDGIGGDRVGDDNYHGVEITELLDYTSLGPQTLSHRATSPAHAFSREGLGSEHLSMFRVDEKPEPGPGSFKLNLSATSTHPGPRCGVVMGRPGSRESGGGGRFVVGRGDESSGGALGGTNRATPGPGNYKSWDAIGTQILSTRPSSPAVVFATRVWELR